MTDNKQDSAIIIDESIYKRINKRVELTSFDTVDDYVAFVMEEVLVAVETTDSCTEDKVDESDVMRQLQDLGYIE